MTADNFLDLLKEKHDKEGLDDALSYLCEFFYKTLDKDKKIDLINDILDKVNPDDWDDSILVVTCKDEPTVT